MVRVRCPSCRTVFNARTAEPVCPGCGFAGRPAPSPQPLVPPPPAPAPSGPARRRRTGLIVVVAVAALLLLGGGAAYYLVWSPWSPLGEDDDEIDTAKLEAAAAKLKAILEDPTPDIAFGMEVRIKAGPITVLTVRSFESPSDQAFEIAFQGEGPDGTVNYTKKQVRGVINYVVGNETYVGRDANPDTRPRQELTESQREAVTVDDLNLTVEESVTLEGRAATRFEGRNESAKLEVWVWDDTLEIGLMRATDFEEGRVLEMRFYYRQEVEITVVSVASKRASFKLESTTAFASDDAGLWAWSNGTVSSKHVEEVPLAEVEMRAVRGAPGNYTVVANMTLTERTTSAGNYTFLYNDADADGRVSRGDFYSFRQPVLDDATLVFWDRWAAAYEGGPTPGFPAWLAAVGAGVVLAWRRGRSEK